MWKHLSEKEKIKVCVKQVKLITLNQLIKKQLLFMSILFLIVLFIGVMLLFPGLHSRTSIIPTLEEIITRSIFCLGISLTLSVIVLLYSLISYYFVPQEIKINKCYKNIFTATDKLCLKCNKSYSKKILICPECNNQLVDRKDYIWIGKIT